MTAENPTRRKITAKEAAAKLGVSPRTIQRMVAEPRAEFEARAEARREKAVTLRAGGLKYTEIAEQMGITVQVVGRLLSDARKHAAKHTDSGTIGPR